MPSVEMRRSTRVFVPKVKDSDFVRVLRSGRRLWVEDVKIRGNKNGDDWFSLIDSEKKSNGWHKVDPIEVDPAPELVNTVVSSYGSEERLFGNVYCRKRKRKRDKVVKKFGLYFVRRKRRKVHTFEKQPKHVKEDDMSGLLSIVIEPFCVGCCFITRVLGTILGYMKRKNVGMVELSAFLLSSPIAPLFASVGIRFFKGLPCATSRGLCRIFGTKQLIPLFTMDYSAAPLCFLSLHTSICFRSVRLSCLCWIDFCRKTESAIDSDESLPVINDQCGELLSKDMASIDKDFKVANVVNSSCLGKSGSRNVYYRSGGVITRSRSKRRHRSLRPRKARSLSIFEQQKTIGPHLSFLTHKRNSSLASGRNQDLRKSARKSSAVDTRVPKPSSNTLSLNVEIDSQRCSANVLVIDTEKCYRVEGAEIVLDVSDSNEWVLAVKKDGLKYYCLKAYKEMRPCTTNRYTHDVIWTGENEWKLEFPERHDWSVFKELYKACAERNVVPPPSPFVKIIPVPVVREVTDAWSSSVSTFKRPDSYIKMTGDELSKALSSRTANYDMDSEDEEWLKNLGNKLDPSDDVTEETFELMIDAFEKASFCNPDDSIDEKAPVDLCMDLASSVAVEEAYMFWMKKRKRKNNPLLIVYQLNQPKRALLISKPVLRKKRSLKRQASQLTQRGRGKDSSILQAIAAEQSAVEDKSAILKVEEAKVSANQSLESAINKRQRAQLLMENADLAIYRATMALRIADAAQVTDIEQAAAHFLD